VKLKDKLHTLHLKRGMSFQPVFNMAKPILSEVEGSAIQNINENGFRIECGMTGIEVEWMFF
jgi:hypothetical protein